MTTVLAPAPSRADAVLWNHTAGSWLSFPPLCGDQHCDVAVVGGGFTGLAAALALRTRGVSVALVEAECIGYRAAGRNGGQIVPRLKPRADHILAAFGTEHGRRMLDFAHAAADHAFDLISRHRIDCSPTRKGWIQSAFSSRSHDNLRRRAEINARHGGNVEFLDASDVRALTGSRLTFGGMIERRAGAVHPLKFARGLAKAAAAAGAGLHESTCARRIDPAGRFVIGGRGAHKHGVDGATARRIFRAATERFPELSTVPWVFAWSCRVAMTMNDLPHVHSLAPGVWTAIGYCGRGVALAIGLGEMLAMLAAGQPPVDAAYPLTPLRRIPLHPLRQPIAAAAIAYLSIKDRLGFPS